MSVAIETNAQNDLKTWLFNPFHYVAGGRALAFGLLFIALAGILGSLSNSHFDGVLDFHTAMTAPLWIFVSEGLINWVSLVMPLVIAGKIASNSSFRLLDVLGTQALARAPIVIAPLACLLPGYRRLSSQMIHVLKSPPADASLDPGQLILSVFTQASLSDIVVYFLATVLTLTSIVWMVALMYRAYVVACNTSGGKSIALFIGAIIVGEVISKILIGNLLSATLAG